MRALIQLVTVAVAALAVPAQAAEGAHRLLGYAYDLETRRFLYTEVHSQRIEGERWLGGSITYIAPDGSLIGTKTLDFTQDPFIPVYRLELKTGGYVEGIAAVGADSIEMYKKGYTDSVEKRKKIGRPETAAADSGFHNLVRARFGELMDRKRVPFYFCVAGNLDVYQFRAQRIEDGVFEGKPVVRFRVDPDTLLLRLLVDPLELSYDPAQRKLLEYHGISNVHDPATGEGYNVRIIYPSLPPPDAPRLPAEYQ